MSGMHGCMWFDRYMLNCFMWQNEPGMLLRVTVKLGILVEYGINTDSLVHMQDGDLPPVADVCYPQGPGTGQCHRVGMQVAGAPGESPFVVVASQGAQ